MDAETAVLTLLAERTFRPEPVPPELLAQVLEAARLTGSGHNLQPWHFILSTDPGRLERLGRLTSHGPYIAAAPACIAVLLSEDTELAVIDGARAIQNMLIVAHARGLGGNWVTPMPEELAELRALLAIPADWRPLALVPLGYPANPRPGRRKRRKPLAEIASRERFGQPLAG